MSSNPIRWLHISDIHTGKDIEGQTSVFKTIIGELENRIENKLCPDLIFITGDIANKGSEDEYCDFCDNFLERNIQHIKKKN